MIGRTKGNHRLRTRHPDAEKRVFMSSVNRQRIIASYLFTLFSIIALLVVMICAYAYLVDI
jgi:hypothetical protein